MPMYFLIDFTIIASSTYIKYTQKYTQNKITEILGIKLERAPISPKERKRCLTCLNQIEGVNHKKKKEALVKTAHKCIRCGETLCIGHFKKIYLGFFQ